MVQELLPNAIYSRSEVTEILGDAALRKRAKVQDLDGRVFPMHPHNYAKQVGQAIRGRNSRLDWQPKDLRNCLPQFAKEQGLLGAVWEEYIGHSPQGVTETYYISRLSALSIGESEAQERAMNLFRRQVLEPLESGISEATGQHFPTCPKPPTDMLDRRSA
jgi:hypothetical protein